MKKEIVLTVGGAAIFIALLSPCSAKKAPAKPDGGKLFQQHCASCHAGGGNTVNPNVPLAESKKLASLATFKQYLSAPPGHMPFYQNLVNDKEMLSALHKYCKGLKRQPLKQAFNESAETLR